MASAAAKSIRPSFELIKVSQVVKSPRGRKAELDPILVEGFAMITTDDDALVLDGYDAPTLLGVADDKDSRAKVSTILRKNWSHVPGQTHKAKIDYGTNGVPQIRRGNLLAKSES